MCESHCLMDTCHDILIQSIHSCKQEEKGLFTPRSLLKLAYKISAFNNFFNYLKHLNSVECEIKENPTRLSNCKHYSLPYTHRVVYSRSSVTYMASVSRFHRVDKDIWSVRG